MPRDHHALSFEGAIDQLRQLILGLVSTAERFQASVAE